MKPPPAPLRIALIYVGVSALWIGLSDWMLMALMPDHLAIGQTFKGILFVLLSGALIYALVRNALRRQRRLEAERERLHVRLAGSQRLEAIGRLTGGIAHDFNNLLTAISGNLEGFLEQVSEEDIPRSERIWLTEATSAARRAEELTRQLLAFGRRQKLQPEPLDLNLIIEEMERLLHRLIGDWVDIESRRESDLWPMSGDPGPLQQVVMNLALNARDAMPDGGTLTLSTSNTHIDERAATDFDFPILPGDYVRLQVRDTGIGMDAETRSRIYEPFFTTKEEHVGTGLGMSTVFGIVKQSDGYITVRSSPGAGTEFDLYFPRTPEPAMKSGMTEHAAAPAPTDGSGETILVVEDDPAVRAVVVRTLQRAGYAVLQATDGVEAVTILREPSRPSVDLLATDAVMPEMTGVELIEIARKARPDLRVLLMSGYDQEQHDSDAPYLAKPFTPKDLIARVRDILNGEQDGR